MQNEETALTEKQCIQRFVGLAFEYSSYLVMVLRSWRPENKCLPKVPSSKYRALDNVNPP